MKPQLPLIITLAGAAIVILAIAGCCAAPMLLMKKGKKDSEANTTCMDHGSHDTQHADAGEKLICPVSGSVANKEISVEHDGKPVYFCCKTCAAEFGKSPETYTAKQAPGDAPTEQHEH